MPATARFACILAFLTAGLYVLNGLTTAVVAVPFGLLPLLAGIGILRGRATAAWGYEFFLVAQFFVLPFITARETTAASGGLFVAMVILTAPQVVLYWRAGRALAAAGGAPGSLWPWVAASLACTIPLLFLQAFVNPTGSMENALLVGDKIFVRVFPKGEIGRGDIIVFHYPVDRKQTFIKRVAGVPGDRIRFVDRALYRNGQKLVEPYATHKLEYPDDYRDNFPNGDASLIPMARTEILKYTVHGELVVPAGKYFVLGDNRDQSLDSRYWGFVSAGDLIGKPLFIYDSRDPNGNRERWDRLLRPIV